MIKTAAGKAAMLVAVLLGVVQARLSLADGLFEADNRRRAGDLSAAENAYRELFQSFRDNEVFQDKYIDLLMARGGYADIVRVFGKVPREDAALQVQRARECQAVLGSNNTRLIAGLIDVSPYSQAVLRAYIQMCLVDERFDDAKRAVARARMQHPDAGEFAQQEMQLLFLSGQFRSGARMLQELGNGRLADAFLGILETYEAIKKTHLPLSTRHARLKTLLKTISLAEGDDNFSPSIFTTLRLDAMFDFCKSGVESGAKEVSARALSLHKRRKTDETMYFYTMALVIDGRLREAEESLEAHPFRNLGLKSYVRRRLDAAKAEAREREQSRKQQYQAPPQRQRAQQNRCDFLGYYEVLGVPSNADAARIKKEYAKIVIKNKGKAKSKDEEKRWNELFKKINKARGVLLDAKKRKLYDSGVDPDNPQGSLQSSGDPFEDIFRNFGAFSFGRGFNPGHGQRHAQRGSTYFYFG